ncbi:MAG: DNA (cytosine-5-)-methyltransferase [Burkholderiaceae bacterium]
MTFTQISGAQVRLHRQQFGLSQAKFAELTGVPQHLLSAYELGKSDLPMNLATMVAAALTRTPEVKALTGRAKRYEKHQYSTVPLVHSRMARARATEGNVIYRSLLADLAAWHAGEKQSGLSAVSLFSGCGGFSLGFSAAGFAVKGYVEIGDSLRRIYRANFPTSSELGSDITGVSDDALTQIANGIGEVDVIVGGPPCQGFSLAGKRDVEDPRNELFRHYLRFVDALRPKIAFLENVRLLTSMKSSNGEFVKDLIAREFRRHGYRIDAFEVNAKDYGVPQHRERVVFVATRSDLRISPSIPAATHGGSTDLFSTIQPCRTFADACSDLPYIESGGATDDPLHAAVHHPDHVVKWLWDVEEGMSAHDNLHANMRPPSGYNTTYKRQVWLEPASTVQTTFGMISGCRNVHPIATRALTVREAARIQSFPDQYRFVGSLGDMRTGIGNAMPPLLAHSLARHARDLLQSR